MNELFAAISAGSTAGVLALGFVIGLKHATDGDHLAAVSTIVSERRRLWGSAAVGGLWGLGHTISLVVAGIAVLLLDIEIGERAERFLEFGVGVMLLFLGLNVLRKIAQGGKLHFHRHGHGPREHAHPHVHGHPATEEPATHHGLSMSPRSLIIGMVHGLAGSAGLMLIVIPTIESRWLGLLYVLVFGFGSIAGMMLMSLIVGLPFHITASRFNRLNGLLQGVAGLASVILGAMIMYEKGFI